MKAKFSKSNIQVNGLISIAVYNHLESIDENLPPNKIISIDLRGLTSSKSGVYCLRNKLNGRIYIGMARNLEVRRNRHWRDLQNIEHVNKLLLQDYQKSCNADICGDGLHPSELFEFEVIIYCRPSELTFYEHLLIKYLNPYYNIHKEKEIKFDVLSDDNL